MAHLASHLLACCIVRLKVQNVMTGHCETLPLFDIKVIGCGGAETLLRRGHLGGKMLR